MWNPFRKKEKPFDPFIDYAALLGMLLVAIVAIKLFELHDYSLLAVTVLLSVGYVLWGVLHHKKAGHIDKKIVLEYTGIALLVDIIVYVLIV